ncbi:hypothetical protein [Vreelandella massiliensis]|uniref:hypothetical protein n=1 Tax=Vreelandella massiliensis TaxID=1816686 RepID=UPI0013FD034A|nr:hypothetical protein [Halomonas massiliensis]
MATPGQLARAGRGEGDAIFVIFDLFGNGDAHGILLMERLVMDGVAVITAHQKAIPIPLTTKQKKRR